MYQVGMYGGSFNPLHMGHIKCLIEAANQCNTLHVIICHSKHRQEVPVKIRYRWIHALTKHIGNVRIHMLEDEASSKDLYGEKEWRIGAAAIKQRINQKIDAVFCGSDYVDTGIFETLYPESQIVYIYRNHNSVSSTEIRNDPYRHWDTIPHIVRPYYVKKVLIVGIESTGKSILTENLANLYNTNFVREIGREITEKAGCEETMISEDFTEILLKHKLNEMEALTASNKLLFIDTDCLTTKYYLPILLSSDDEITTNSILADAIQALNRFELVLFLEPDNPFVQDGTRNERIAQDRQKYRDLLLNALNLKGIPVKHLSGSYQQRFLNAVKYVNQLFRS